MSKLKVHPTAEVNSINIGENTQVWQNCIILAGAILGRDCNINCMVFIENDVVIGDRVTIKPGVQVWDGIHIEDDAFIGPNVTFTNDLVPRSKIYPEKFLKTIVCKGASIGANSTIIGGITIGPYAVIGAGSVVTKDIPPHTLWYGNPAGHRGYVTADGEILDMHLKSTKTGVSYQLKNSIISPL